MELDYALPLVKKNNIKSPKRKICFVSKIIILQFRGIKDTDKSTKDLKICQINLLYRSCERLKWFHDVK